MKNKGFTLMELIISLVMIGIIVTLAFTIGKTYYETKKRIVSNQIQPDVTIPGTKIGRYIDKEAGIVCYTIGSQAMSCIPISQTKLTKQ